MIGALSSSPLSGPDESCLPRHGQPPHVKPSYVEFMASNDVTIGIRLSLGHRVWLLRYVSRNVAVWTYYEVA
jgi:hypothetical protein